MQPTIDYLLCGFRACDALGCFHLRGAVFHLVHSASQTIAITENRCVFEFCEVQIASFLQDSAEKLHETRETDRSVSWGADKLAAFCVF